MAEGGSPRVAYWGFLSYSHKDASAAAKLHRRLEGYRLPAKLVGLQTPAGDVPARLTPIFRDREDLSAGTDLSEQVQDALANSRGLIILCSPNAKASIWVNKEIETFRRLHPDGPLLAAILDGDPTDAFPDALTQGGAEPIAADLRDGEDGWRLGLLKIVSGMTAVPLDALVRRDAQRQLRRVMAVTVSAMILVVAMTTLAVLAVRARSDAERQRVQAEGLVEYMLTDLRDKLKGVGRLDVMTAVNERAMRYYGGASVKGQILKARTLHALGEDDQKRGDMPAAEAKFLAALQLTTALAQREPSNPSVIFAHAQSQYWLGFSAEQSGKLERASVFYRDYAAAGQRLRQLDPANVDYMMEDAWGQLNQGIVIQSQSAKLGREQPEFRQRIAQSNALFERAARTFTLVLAKRPDDQKVRFELANTKAWLSDGYFYLADFKRALAYRRDENILKRQIAESDPRDRSSLFTLANSHYAMARILIRMGNIGQAQADMKIALGLLNDLHLADPGNTEWLEQLALATAYDAQIWHNLGKANQAKTTFETAKSLGVTATKRNSSRSAEIADALGSLPY